MAGTWAGALVDTSNLPTSDYFIPYIVQKIMPVGLAGTFLAAPMAAVMSTADSLLILASAAIVKDLWRNYVVKDDPVKVASYNKNVGKLSTLVTFAFGVIVILLTINHRISFLPESICLRRSGMHASSASYGGLF